MKRESATGISRSLTRRAFLSLLAALGGAVGFKRALGHDRAQAAAWGRPVVSFHMDHPYLDWSGTAVPYYPPPGVRSGQVLANLDEESLRLQHWCL